MRCVDLAQGRVYDASDDTFLLSDWCEAELHYSVLQDISICAEVGSGSGYVTSTLALCNAAYVLALDASSAATHATQNTMSACGATGQCSSTAAHAVDVVQADLLKPVANRLWKSIDLLAVNPPYVPTSTSEMEQAQRTLATPQIACAGGTDGREVIDRILPMAADVLAPGGVLLLVLLEANKPAEVCSWLMQHGFKSASVVESRKADEERLHLVRALRHGG